MGMRIRGSSLSGGGSHGVPGPLRAITGVPRERPMSADLAALVLLESVGTHDEPEIHAPRYRRKKDK